MVARAAPGDILLAGIFQGVARGGARGGVDKGNIKKGRQKPAQEVQRESVVFRALPPGVDLSAQLDVAIHAVTAAGIFRLVTKERGGVQADHRASPVAGASLPLLRSEERRVGKECSS